MLQNNLISFINTNNIPLLKTNVVVIQIVESRQASIKHNPCFVCTVGIRPRYSSSGPVETGLSS